MGEKEAWGQERLLLPMALAFQMEESCVVHRELAVAILASQLGLERLQLVLIAPSSLCGSTGRECPHPKDEEKNEEAWKEEHDHVLVDLNARYDRFGRVLDGINQSYQYTNPESSSPCLNRAIDHERRLR
ncbi:hypothetical protein ACLOJK_017758 [Asimina triloba]